MSHRPRRSRRPNKRSHATTSASVAENPPALSSIFTIAPQPQPQSPLLTRLPAEIRHMIWTLTLSEFLDLSPGKTYSVATYYSRPSYEAPRKSDARLLRTCRAIYFECWTLPFLLREHTWWLAWEDRRPREFNYEESWNKLETSLKLARWSHLKFKEQMRSDQEGETDKGVSVQNEMAEMAELRAFAQLCELEGGALERLLRMEGLNPRRVTLTIRHADWWHWETDNLLGLVSHWVPSVASVLSPSTREFIIEMETVARKKHQLDHVAAFIVRSWFFRRIDGQVLYGDVTGKSNKVSRWRGASTWDGQRWVRDECEPGLVEYYVVAVPFRTRDVVERRGGEVNKLLDDPEYDLDDMRVVAPGEPIADDV